jgi:response regulator of citrate/malate metabolism
MANSSDDPSVQHLIDDFFKRFPSPREAHLRETFETKRSRIASSDPAQQTALDAIYDAMARTSSPQGQPDGTRYSLPPGRAREAAGEDEWEPALESG